MANPQALHAALVDWLDDWERDVPQPEPLLAAMRDVVELHKPELFGGFIACLACSPGMPPPLLIEWKDCQTVKVISAALGVTTDG